MSAHNQRKKKDVERKKTIDKNSNIVISLFFKVNVVKVFYVVEIFNNFLKT